MDLKNIFSNEKQRIFDYLRSKKELRTADFSQLLQLIAKETGSSVFTVRQVLERVENLTSQSIYNPETKTTNCVYQFGNIQVKSNSTIANPSYMLEESVFEKVLKELEGETRQKLLEQLIKILKIRYPNWSSEEIDEEIDFYGNFSDERMRKVIADLKAKMTINADLEYKKAVAQNKTRYGGKQGARAYKSFRHH
jgi:hypothetical protein